MINVRRKKKFQIRRSRNKNKIPTANLSLSSSPPWIELPRDVTANILQRLCPIEILDSAQKVCTTWRSVSQDPSLWRVIDMKNPDYRDDMPDDVYLCRQAVDRSQGQLIDINIEYFGTDKLLNHISKRSSHLKRLRLACCDGISSTGLRESVKKFLELEELHLFFMPSILARDIETIGISCPMLKSFTFNDRGYRFPLIETDDKYALAVAKSMPNLLHLRLFGNRMTNVGLQAILDGCPYLESLDLRQCFNVYILGDLDKRCLQIKDLRRPQDSTIDYEWDAEIYDCEDDEYYSSDVDDIYTLGDYEDYDDYTNPFNNEYFSDNDAWHFFDHSYF